MTSEAQLAPSFGTPLALPSRHGALLYGPSEPDFGLGYRLIPSEFHTESLGPLTKEGTYITGPFSFESTSNAGAVYTSSLWEIPFTSKGGSTALNEVKVKVPFVGQSRSRISTDIEIPQTFATRKFPNYLERGISKVIPAIGLAGAIAYSSYLVESSSNAPPTIRALVENSNDATWGPAVSEQMLRSITASRIYGGLARALAVGGTEEFKDGYESDLAHWISAAVSAYHSLAVDTLRKLLTDHKYSIDVMYEAFKSLGSVEDPDSRGARAELLIEMLKHPSALIRDSAGLGLADMKYKEAIPYIKAALETERNSILRNNFLESIEQLQA